MIKTLAGLFSLAVLTMPLDGADFYLDNAATGANNGTSWNDAWQSVNDINWASIADGDDTIYVSGGTTSKTYTDQGAVSGSFHYWQIEESVTIKKSQEAGHNGTIIWDSKITVVSDGVTIDGRVSDAVDYSTIYMDNVDAIKNNCGWQITEPWNSGIQISGQANENVLIVGMEVKECGLSSDETSHGVRTNIDGGLAFSNVMVQGCWIYWCRDDGLSVNQNDATGYGGFVADRCIFEFNGDDGIQMAAGCDIRYCSVGEPIPLEKGGPQGHPDAIQWAKDFTRIYNCLIRGTDAACIYGEMTWQTGEIDEAKGDVLIYGNIIYDPGGNEPNTGAQFGMQYNTGASTVVTLENYVAVHNTIIGTIAQQPAIAAISDTEFTSVTINDWFFSNNLIYDTQNGVAVRVGDLPPTGNDNFETVTEAEARVDYNIAYGTSDGFDWNSTAYASAAAFHAATTFSNNTNAQPILVDVENLDLRLSVSDTVARDNAVALSGYIDADILANMPDYNKDLYGNTRGADGSPDIGAIEYAGPVLHYTFETDFSTSVEDVSGNSNDGVKYGFPSGSPVRWPESVSVTNGSNTSTGAAFDYVWDGYGTYGKSGDYVAIETVNEGEASKATIMLWAKYAPNDLEGGGGTYTDYNNTALLSNGQYSVAGGWSLGHQNTYASDVNIRDTKFIFWVDADHANRSQLTFGDTNNADGSTDAMAHYAVTFDSGVITIFLNGTQVGTETVAHTTINLNTTTHWLGIGGGPHHASTSRDAWLEEDGYGPYDEYPNWRWFHGEIDNVRIYNRALSATEVGDVYSSEAAAGGGGEPGPSPTPTISTGILRIGP